MRRVKTRRMEIGANRRDEQSLAQDFSAALEWWRGAGIECDYVDDPVDWLAGSNADATAGTRVARTPKPAAPSPPVQKEPEAFAPDALPSDLATFSAWWMAEPALDEGRVAGRVPPRGNAGARLMVVVPQPEKDDTERLLSGPQGRLLDAILASFGIAPADVYVASALPRHTPMADWAEIGRRGMGAVLRRHVRLVAPAGMMVLGGNILPLFGNAPPQAAAVLQQFNHEDGTTPMLAAWELHALLNAPLGKGALWKAWLEGQNTALFAAS